MDDQHTTITAALREAADLLDQHPELPRPYITSSVTGRVEVSWYLHGRHDLHEQKELATRIVRTIRGRWDKSTDSGLGFSFARRHGLMNLFVSVDQPAVCERVVVGTEERTIPAVEAQPERVETVEKVEWRCQPLLAEEPSAGVVLAERHIAEAKVAAEIGAIQHESHDLSAVEA